MATGLVKRNDAWVNFKEAWVKRSGIWTKAQAVYQKESGVWTLKQTPPQPPPQPPTISLEIDELHRIKVGIRYPAINPAPEIKKIRVLVSRTAMPTTQFGTGVVKEAANSWKGEFWSHWAYKYSAQDYLPPPVLGSGLGDGDQRVNLTTGEPDPNGTLTYRIHTNTAQTDYKLYPPNADSQNPLPAGQWYYFAGWTLDVNDQWSAGTFAKIFMTQPGVSTGVIQKEANFQPNSSGYLFGTDLINEPDGDLLTVANSSQGVFFYSHKITNVIGADGPINDTVTGTVRLSRDNDAYSPSANVWMWWHDEATSAGAFVPANHRFGITKIGTIAKGETKLLDIPNWSNTDWNNNIKGIGFGWSPTPVTSDNSIILGQGRDPRSGELNLKWGEVA